MSGDLTVPGVPETITSERCRELIKGLGLDPLELVSLEFQEGGIGIKAEVYAQDELGQRYLSDRYTIATHQITIRITDGGDPA
jgi:hypothetical protein